jgi:hypothetical protein
MGNATRSSIEKFLVRLLLTSVESGAGGLEFMFEALGPSGAFLDESGLLVDAENACLSL